MKNNQKGFTIPLLVTIIAVLAIGGSIYIYKTLILNSSPNTSTNTSSSGQIDLSKLLSAQIPDFVNGGTQLLVLSNGQYKGTFMEGKAGNELSIPFEINLNLQPSSYAQGDLDGDGMSDIAGVFVENTGGSGSFNYLAVFVNNNGTPKYVASKFMGDRITVNKVSISNGIVSVDIVTQGPNEPMCCGTLHKTLSYRLSANSLIQEINSTSPNLGFSTYNNFGITFQYPEKLGVPKESFYGNGFGSLSFDNGSSNKHYFPCVISINLLQTQGMTQCSEEV